MSIGILLIVLTSLLNTLATKYHQLVTTHFSALRGYPRGIYPKITIRQFVLAFFLGHETLTHRHPPHPKCAFRHVTYGDGDQSAITVPPACRGSIFFCVKVK